MFNKYRKRRVHNTANLLTGEADVAPGTVKVAQGATDVVPDIISYYHPNLTINLVEDYTQWSAGSVPQPLDKCESRRKGREGKKRRGGVGSRLQQTCSYKNF